MKAIVLSVFAALLLIGLQAKAKKVKGLLYTNKDSIEVLIKMPKHFIFNEPKIKRLQKVIRYVTKDGKRRRVIPSVDKGVKFEYKGYSYKMNSVKLKHKYYFLLAKVEDDLSLFLYFDKQYELHHATTKELPLITGMYVLQKSGSKAIRPKPGVNKFKKSMRGYFNDCFDLALKIEEKVLQHDDVFQILHYYNNECK